MSPCVGAAGDLDRESGLATVPGDSPHAPLEGLGGGWERVQRPGEAAQTTRALEGDRTNNLIYNS